MKQSHFVLGIILVGAGILLGLASFELIPGVSIFYLLALGFWAAYYLRGRQLGFLIPAAVLTAFGVFVSVSEMFPGLHGIYFLVSLGIAFLTVFLLHTSRLSGDWGEKYWPLFPAISLLTISALVLAVEEGNLPFDLRYINLLFPAVLVAAGVRLLLKHPRASR